MSDDCLSFAGTLDGRRFTGTRMIGPVCTKGQTVECTIANGKGVRTCCYGYWCAQPYCVRTSCNPGFVPDPANDEACKPAL